MALGKQVVVVGAGLGGLSCAIDLARSGFRVTVVERSPTAGGKMREVAIGPCRIDAGPTVLTLRWVFDQIFADAGASLDDHLRLRPLAVLARHAWGAGDRLDLFADIDRTAQAIGDFAGRAESAGYRAFCAEARGIYTTLRDSFLTAQQTSAVGLAKRIGFSGAGALLALRPFETLWRALCSHFRDPRLRQLFGRYATYCGSSPFAAPATLMLIAHVEQEGVWVVEGGMQRIADALQALARSLGVVFQFSAHVDTVDVESGRVAGVTLATGEPLAAQAVVLNADPAALAGGAFGRDVAALAAETAARRSLSAVTWTMLARTGGFPLLRHNVFFSDDYRAEFEDIFRNGRLPRAPTIYVCAQDRHDADLTAPGPERLLVLINAPAAGDHNPLSEQEISACEVSVSSHLRRCGLDVRPERDACVTTTPTRFATMFPATGGALYGRATHGWSAAFDRPGARTKTPGLYLAGGGAHPGPGAPMAALSGRLAASALISDHASTSRWRPVVIPGGMSTR